MDPTPALRFKAGKLLHRGGQLIADTRKGRIEIARSGERITLKWFERDGDTAEDRLEWEAGEGTFRHLSNCTDGQAFGLRVLSTSRNEEFFMWIQEPDLSNYAAEFSARLNSLVCPSLRLPTKAASGGLTKSPRPKPTSYRQPMTFREVISAEEVEGVLQGNEVLGKYLCELLPPSFPKSVCDLVDLVRCPQFQQTLSFMDESLPSGDLDPLLLEIGVDPIAVKSLAESFRGDYLRALLVAIKAKFQK